MQPIIKLSLMMTWLKSNLAKYSWLSKQPCWHCKHIQVSQLVITWIKHSQFCNWFVLGDKGRLYHVYRLNSPRNFKEIWLVGKELWKNYELFLISISLHGDFYLWSYLNCRYGRNTVGLNGKGLSSLLRFPIFWRSLIRFGVVKALLPLVVI